MKTLFYDWKENINAEELENVIKVIVDGGVVIFPTDTVYGVAANSLDETAIKKLFDLKIHNYYSICIEDCKTPQNIFSYILNILQSHCNL